MSLVQFKFPQQVRECDRWIDNEFLIASNVLYPRFLGNVCLFDPADQEYRLAPLWPHDPGETISYRSLSGNMNVTHVSNIFGRNRDHGIEGALIDPPAQAFDIARRIRSASHAASRSLRPSRVHC
jgi:hypothetical protein